MTPGRRHPRSARHRTEPTSRRSGPAPPSPEVVKVSGPADLLSLLPFLLGYHPTESLVAMVVEGPRRRVGLTVRMDLPSGDVPFDDAVSSVVGILGRQGATEALLVVYAAEDGSAQAFAAEVMRALGQRGIAVRDAWRADGRRWFSLVCGDPACCPAEGTPYDTATTAVAAQAVYRGEVAAPDREALRASVAPLAAAADAIAAATERAMTELLEQVGTTDPGREWARHGMPWITAVVQSFVASPRLLEDDECARISVWIAHVGVRDAAWCLMRADDVDAHVDLWTQVTRRAAPGHVAAAASLLGFACWLRGDGTLARLAVERALADDPHYSMAGLLEGALDRAVPPAAWSPMPLEELYAAAGLPSPARRPSPG